MKQTRRTPDPKDERREGYKLAITMLRELEASPELCDACGLAIPAKQNNIVLRYLEESRERSPDAAAGFCAVLSDFVADCSEGFVPNAANYQKGLKIRLPKPVAISQDAERLRAWKAVQQITGKDYGPMPADWGK
jgi:hypothetical protein